MHWLGFILIGVITGSMSGFFGVGGGVILVPMLVHFMGFSQQSAQGTSLALLSVPVVLFAAFKYYQSGWVQLPIVGWIILGFLIGSVAGAELVSRVPAGTLQRCFGLVLLYIGFEFVFSEERQSKAILPAMVGATVTFLVAWIWRRLKKEPAGPSSEPEYHI